MMVVGCSLALLVIFAGTKLLIQVKQEALAKFYKFIAWFLIGMGFLMLIGATCFSIAKFCYHGEKMMEKRMKMMKHGNMHEPCGRGHGGMMKHHMRSNDECCGDMMMGRNYCGNGMGQCQREAEECHGKMGNECRSWNSKCDDYGKCSAKPIENKKDSAVK